MFKECPEIVLRGPNWSLFLYQRVPINGHFCLNLTLWSLRTLEMVEEISPQSSVNARVSGQKRPQLGPPKLSEDCPMPLRRQFLNIVGHFLPIWSVLLSGNTVQWQCMHATTAGERVIAEKLAEVHAVLRHLVIQVVLRTTSTADHWIGCS